ncbi:hypothetical protein Dimus_031639, partial [Dionaea muscipula]
KDVEHDEDNEDNIPLSSSVEVLRRRNEDDDSDVPLSLKYHTTPQSLIPVDDDLEVVGVNPAVMEVDVDDNSLILIGDDGELYGIDDVDALIDIVIENTVDKILEDTNDKVDMESAEEVVKEFREQEATERAKAAKAKT